LEIAEEEWHVLEEFQGLGRAKGVSALLRRLPHLHPVVAWHAVGRVLPELGGKHAYRALVQTLREHPDPALREAAAYALWQFRDDRAHPLLLAALRDPAEDPRVRGQAAETLGYTTRDARTRRYKETARALVDALGDPSPTVRFWAASALGGMRARAATPALRRLAATDQAVCPGWWRVADEAADALVRITGGTLPERYRTATAGPEPPPPPRRSEQDTSGAATRVRSHPKLST
jgi:HEAT repeat protein